MDSIAHAAPAQRTADATNTDLLIMLFLLVSLTVPHQRVAVTL